MQQIKHLSNESCRNEILALLNAGEMAAARQMADAFLESSPKDPDAHYASGLVQLMQGEAEDAVVSLKKAYQQVSDNPAYAANLGVACHRAGEMEQALKYLKVALELKPDYEQARYNLGCAYLDHQQAEQALKYFSELTKNHPDNADYLCAEADALREMQRYKKAVKLYRRALEIDPKLVRALTNLSPFLMQAGQEDEAIDYCRKAIELNPLQINAYINLGDCLIQQEALDEAMDVFADAYESETESADLCTAIGKLWLETAEQAEASSWFQKALLLDEDNIVALCGLANIVKDNGNLPQALEMLEPLLEKEPDNIDLLLSLADVLWEDGDAETALLHLRHVQRLQPERIAVHGKIGQILSSSGDVDRAIEEYQTALDQNPNCIPALNGLATSQRGKLDAANVKTMEKMLAQNKRLKSGARSSLHSGLAFYYDSKIQLKKAAEHMRQANFDQWDNRSKRGWQYENQQQEDHISALIETFDKAYFERIKALGNPDETPVFIVAMPRSGTTLTEQILARHASVLGIGERNFASQAFNQFIHTGDNQLNTDFSNLKSITATEVSSITKRYLKRLQQLKDKAGQADALRVVDKMPDNYSLIGWIVTLFPNARIIHAARDPRDVALSCWMTQFGSIRWACHTEHLVHRIQQYQRIMEHWRQVIPEHFIELNYEDMVANQEQESRRLIEYIGLEWDQDCLKFYESDRLVRTASITQVRQPIYNKSVARWKNYQPYIAELFEPLMPLS